MSRAMAAEGLVTSDRVEEYDGTTAVLHNAHLSADEIEFLRWRRERWIKLRHFWPVLAHSPRFAVRHGPAMLRHTFRGASWRTFLGLEDERAAFQRYRQHRQDRARLPAGVLTRASRDIQWPPAHPERQRRPHGSERHRDGPQPPRPASRHRHRRRRPGRSRLLRRRTSGCAWSSGRSTSTTTSSTTSITATSTGTPGDDLDDVPLQGPRRAGRRQGGRTGHRDRVLGAGRVAADLARAARGARRAATEARTPIRRGGALLSRSLGAGDRLVVERDDDRGRRGSAAASPADAAIRGLHSVTLTVRAPASDGRLPARACSASRRRRERPTRRASRSARRRRRPRARPRARRRCAGRVQRPRHRAPRRARHRQRRRAARAARGAGRARRQGDRDPRSAVLHVDLLPRARRRAASKWRRWRRGSPSTSRRDSAAG